MRPCRRNRSQSEGAPQTSAEPQQVPQRGSHPGGRRHRPGSRRKPQNHTSLPTRSLTGCSYRGAMGGALASSPGSGLLRKNMSASLQRAVKAVHWIKESFRLFPEQLADCADARSPQKTASGMISEGNTKLDSVSLRYIQVRFHGTVCPLGSSCPSRTSHSHAMCAQGLPRSSQDHRDQHWPVELSVLMEIPAPSNTCPMASEHLKCGCVTEELNVSFYFILIN